LSRYRPCDSKRRKEGEAYNVEGNNEWTNIAIVNLVCKLMDEYNPNGAPYEKLITHVTDRLGMIVDVLLMRQKLLKN